MDVPQMPFIIRVIPNNMIVKRFLPNTYPNLSGHNALQLLYNPCHRRGDQWSPVKPPSGREGDHEVVEGACGSRD